MRAFVVVAVAGVACVVSASCGGGGDHSTPVTAPPVVGSVRMQPDSASVLVGATTQLSASVLDANGTVLTGRVVTWSSADASRVLVSSAGLATGVAAGRVAITATSEGKSATAVVIVTSKLVGDVSIAGVQFTQGVQDAGGTIPIVLEGDAAVVNVLLQATTPTNAPMQVVLRLFNAAGAVVRTDTAVTRGTLGATSSYDAPSVQFLVPSAVLQAGLRWQVARDPRGAVPDDSATTDVFPRAGFASLATVTVPTLNVRFVPIVLASHGNVTGLVTDANIPEYLRTLKSIHPLGRVTAHVGTPFTTSANFGTPPSGGDAPFWQQVVGELDLARIADPTEPDANWYGVIVPPPGFNFTTFGGFSYIPLTGTSIGPHTRTSTGVQLNWFNRPTQARDLVAHELGHTFGRSHAPCGNPASPLDLAYPVPGGTLDQAGTDVYSWATNLTASAFTVPASTGDVMGYCFPVWASTYTYRAVLQFRQPIVAAAQPAPIARVLVMRGRIENGSTITLEPAFVMNGRSALPERTGPYQLDGLDAAGRVLFSYAFEPAVLDHAPNLRHFTIAVPATPELDAALETIVVRGPGAEARVTAAASSEAAGIRAPARAALMRRELDGMLRVSCPETTARGVLAVDGVTGTLLGIAPASSMRARIASGTPLTILCSDGVRTTRSGADAP